MNHCHNFLVSKNIKHYMNLLDFVYFQPFMYVKFNSSIKGTEEVKEVYKKENIEEME